MRQCLGLNIKAWMLVERASFSTHALKTGSPWGPRDRPAAALSWVCECKLRQLCRNSRSPSSRRTRLGSPLGFKNSLEFHRTIPRSGTVILKETVDSLILSNDGLSD